MEKTAETDAFWLAFRSEHPHAPLDYLLIGFGGSDRALATELANLVVNGPKRATATLLRDFETGVEPVFPQVGDFWVLFDGDGHPRAILQTTQVDISAFGDVDAAFAWDEGEGDRTLADWRAGHTRYFERMALTRGFEFNDNTMVVLERFRLVWPDRGTGVVASS
jgi:uncharacterized protein YhfF